VIEIPDKLFEGLYAKGTFFDDKTHEFLADVLSAELRKKESIVTVRYRRTKPEIYVYNKEKGYYEPDGDQILRLKIKKILKGDYKEAYAKATIDDITASKQITAEEFRLPELLVPVANGLLDISEFPCKLIPHDPKYYVISTLPYPYDPEAKCPTFEKYLKEVLPGEMDRLRLQEHMGYLLYGKNIFQIAVLLTGPPDSGKSTLLYLLKALLGKENVVHITLQDLITDRFASAQLDKKYACIFADLPRITLQTSGIISALITGDGVNTQNKFKSRREIDLRAKFWFSANQIPFTYDTSDKFFKRWDIFTFPNQFLRGDPRRDNHLIDKLINERSGILNWMLEGLERLLANKNFINAKSIEEVREKWLLGSSSLYEFVKNCVEMNPALFETKENFYSAYVEYCAKHNLPILDIKVVGRQLPRILPGTRTSYPKIGKKQVMAWQGIHIIKD
jgi:putative DNA primase/helicase